MLRDWADRMYLKGMMRVQAMLKREEGDTNFISILIILGVVVILAGVFMAFKDQIVGQVNNIINNFTIH